MSGIRFYLDVHRERLSCMRNRKVTFDFGAWLQTSLLTSMLPYTTQAFPALLIALEPDRWMLQVPPDDFICFDHRVEEIMGTHLVNYEGHLMLPPLDAPMRDTRSLSNLDFRKCFVEVDVVAMSMSGKEQQHTLAVVPFQPQQYGQTCEHHPTHLDFRPLVVPTYHLNQLRVHLRNSEDVGLPFYMGLVGLLLYFHKGPASLPSSMRLQGGPRVMLESNAQLELFPENKPAHFRIRLPNMWYLDRTWEVGLFQLLLPHSWHNVLTQQVGTPPLQLGQPGCARVSAGGHLRHGAGHGGRLASTHGSQRAQGRRHPRIDDGLGRARFLQVDLSQR